MTGIGDVNDELCMIRSSGQHGDLGMLVKPILLNTATAGKRK